VAQGEIFQDEVSTLGHGRPVGLELLILALNLRLGNVA
jgi:hypothetical protein